MELEQIKRQLQEALSPRTPPLSLTRGDARSCGVVRYESDWMNGLFLGKLWHEVDPAAFESDALIDALSCLNPDAVAYYLPTFALLTAHLRSIAPVEALMGHLKDERVRISVQEMYSREELSVVAAALEETAKDFSDADFNLVGEVIHALRISPGP